MPEESRRATTRLDPRSPLVLDTRELGRRPGSMRSLSRSVPAPADLGVEVLGVPEGSALELDLRLESVVEGVLVSGTVTRHRDGRVRALPRPGRRVRSWSTSRSSTPIPAHERRRGRRHGAVAGARGRPDRPRAGAAGRGGARTAARSRCAGTTARGCAPSAGRGSRTTRTTRTTRSTPGGRPWATWPPTPSTTARPDRPARPNRGETDPWPFPSGRCRAATPARAGRSGRRRGSPGGLQQLPRAQAAAHRPARPAARTTAARSSTSEPP